MSQVKVYSTPSCPWCLKAKEFFKQHKIPFKDFNVAENSKAAREMVKKSGQMGVPVIEIGKEIIIGYDEDTLKEILKIK
ncbi:NrdH-redoxin [Candidatus Pacearchaeota archaeon RBG_16_35_8]|nr:MAG: NrdH-redoxin [Candidatus Pacearchaeota archaeon RBG_16_35_8]